MRLYRFYFFFISAAWKGSLAHNTQFTPSRDVSERFFLSRLLFQTFSVIICTAVINKLPHLQRILEGRDLELAQTWKWCLNWRRLVRRTLFNALNISRGTVKMSACFVWSWRCRRWISLSVSLPYVQWHEEAFVWKGSGEELRLILRAELVVCRGDCVLARFIENAWIWK